MARAHAASGCVQSDSIKGLAQSIAKPAYHRLLIAEPALRRAVPTLIIAADGDQLAPLATAERMQRAIPDSRLVVFSGHSHLVQVEKPAEVHAAIDRFLADHSL